MVCFLFLFFVFCGAIFLLEIRPLLHSKHLTFLTMGPGARPPQPGLTEVAPGKGLNKTSLLSFISSPPASSYDLSCGGLFLLGPRFLSLPLGLL